METRVNNSYRNIFILITFCFVLFLSGNEILGLTNPDEVFYAQTAKEMAQQNTWSTPYLFGQPQFEKPIITFWLLRTAFILFGATSFAARFFPAMFASAGVIALYFFCLYACREEKKSFIAALILASSGLYFILAKTVFTDMFFSLFILLSLASFFIGYLDKNKNAAGIFGFFIFSALAFLTKGLLGIAIPFLTVILFLVWRRDLKIFRSKYSLFAFLLFLLIALPWYFFMINKFGANFIHEFLYNDHIRRLFEAEHASNDTWYFYPLSMVACMFPWSIYTAAAFFYLIKKLRRRENLALYQFLLSWIAVTFLLLQFAHSKLVSYIFPSFGALAVITGDFIYDTLKVHKRLAAVLAYCSLFLFLVFPAAVFAASRLYPRYSPGGGALAVFITLYLAVVAAIVFFIVRKRLFLSLCASSLITPLIFFFVLSVHRSFEDYASSKGAAGYLLDNYKVENTVICSKFFVRGIRYYTDKNIAALDLGGKGFFSPHPLILLNSEQKVKKFLRGQAVTYCVLRAKDFKRIRRIINKDFSYDHLGTFGNEYLLRIKRS